MRATSCVLLLACLACGPAPPPQHELAPTPAPASAPVSQHRETGSITRAELRGFLNQGMQTLIANVVVDRYPRARAQRFRGWRIVEFFPGDARFASVDVKPGDVILRVNGRSLETPKQLDETWNALKVAKELVVETLRVGQARILRWRIVE